MYFFMLWRLLASRSRSAVRLGLGIAVVYAFWMYLPALRTYARLVNTSVQLSQQVNATPRQLPSMNLAQPPLPPPNTTQRPSLPADVEQRTSQSVSIAQGPKLSANGLEIALQREPQFRPESQLHCKKATPGWDYTCSYMRSDRDYNDYIGYAVEKLPSPPPPPTPTPEPGTLALMLSGSLVAWRKMRT